MSSTHSLWRRQTVSMTVTMCICQISASQTKVDGTQNLGDEACTAGGEDPSALFFASHFPDKVSR